MNPVWIAFVAALIMAGVIGGVFYLAVKQNAVIGTTTIRFLTIVFVLSLLVILGITNVIGRETIGPIIGVLVGYVLSGFGKEA